MKDEQLIQTVKEFIKLCDELLQKGSITEEDYYHYTWFKKEFLKRQD